MKKRDAKSTLEMLPYHKKSSVEQQLLRGLLKTRNDYQASFSSVNKMAIPRNVSHVTYMSFFHLFLFISM